MNKPTEEQIKSLIKFDIFCQDNNRAMDTKLSDIYNSAKGTGYGWPGVAKEDPEVFWKAFKLINSI